MAPRRNTSLSAVNTRLISSGWVRQSRRSPGVGTSKQIPRVDHRATPTERPGQRPERNCEQLHHVTGLGDHGRRPARSRSTDRPPGDRVRHWVDDHAHPRSLRARSHWTSSGSACWVLDGDRGVEQFASTDAAPSEPDLLGLPGTGPATGDHHLGGAAQSHLAPARTGTVAGAAGARLSCAIGLGRAGDCRGGGGRGRAARGRELVHDQRPLSRRGRSAVHQRPGRSRRAARRIDRERHPDHQRPRQRRAVDHRLHQRDRLAKLSAALAQTAGLTGELAADRAGVAQLIDTAGRAAQAVASRRPDLQGAVANTARALGAIARERTAFSDDLGRPPAVLRQATPTLSLARSALVALAPDLVDVPAAAQPLSVVLRRPAPTAQRLRPVVGQLQRGLPSLNLALTGLRPLAPVAVDALEATTSALKDSMHIFKGLREYGSDPAIGVSPVWRGHRPRRTTRPAITSGSS
jgi:hypothetical protein